MAAAGGSLEAPALRPRVAPADCCPRCWQRREVCFCARYPRVETTTEIVILRHVVEQVRSSSTARIAALALPNARLLDFGGGAPFDEAALLPPEESWLLYPDAGGPVPGQRLKRIVVLDGSWRQARKMFLRVAPLQRMPRLVLSPASAPRPRLRKPPRDGALSTLEAIAEALRLLEGDAVGETLLALHEEVAERGLYMRGLKFDGTLTARRKGEPGFDSTP